MFGGTSQFSFGGAPSTSPFGATSTTATAAPTNTGFMFGSQAAPAAGTTASAPLNSTFTFGTAPANNPVTAQTSAQPLNFGTGLQSGSTIRPFGSTTAFGTTQAATAPATGMTGFGGGSLFGATQPAAQPSSIFGAPQPAQPTTMFGSTLGAAVSTTQIGTTVKFEPVAGQDTMRTKNNTFQTINTKLQCISAMKEYVNKSMEELRMEDYQSNRKFPAAGSLFGASNFSTGTTFNPSPFAGGTTFSAAPTSTATSSLFGGTSTATTSPFSAGPVTSNPFTFNAAPAQPSSMFGGAAASNAATPFGTTLATTQAPSSIFGTTQPTSNVFGAATTTSPFGAKQVTTQPTFGFGTATSTATPFSFGSQPAASTSIFSQPTTATPFGTTAPTSTSSIFGFPSSTAAAPAATNIFGAQPATTSIFGSTTSTAAPVFGGATATPAFTGFGTNPATSTATNIFGAPATSVATSAPMFGGFGTQATAPTSSPFSFATTSSAPSIFGSTAPAATTSSMFNPQPFAGFGMSQPQLTAAAAPSFNFSAPFGSTTAAGFGAPTNLAQPQMQQQNMPQQISLVQQRFLAASLLDPFNSRGKKDFNETEQIKPPTDFIVVSNATTTTTSATSSTSAPITLPLQSNARKNSGARPLVDIRFRLKPVSSSPTSNFSGEEIKSPNPPPVTSFGPIKSPLTADFSEEEELALIGKNKLSKLRLSNDFIESSFHSDSIRSLYPMRRLAELETLANMNNNTHTIPSSTTTIDTASAHVSSSTVNNEQTLHPSGGNRPMLPLHHSTPLIGHKQPSPPVSQLSTTMVQSPTSPPAPSTTPPPSSTNTATMSRGRTFFDDEDYKKPPAVTRSQSDTRSYRTPILTRSEYYMKPSVAELKSRFDDHGECLVKEFTVGHETFGSVTFYGLTNVAGLDLDRIIEINRHEVTVYPDDNNKPPAGEELNIPARITLLGVYPIDRATREEITDVERIRAMNYGDYLREVTKKFDGEFINYGLPEGSWTFMVKHFTRYGLDGSEDDFVVAKPPATQTKPVAKAAKPINANFLDQTIALNDTYALSSPPKSQAMDMDEKENTASIIGLQSNVRFANQSLIGLRPAEVEQLVQSMFDDEDDDEDFNNFQQIDDRMITSTKIITSNQRPMPPIRGSEPLADRSSATMIEADQSKNQLTYIAPNKPQRQHVYATLPKNIAKARGKYFRTNFSADLQYASIDALNESRILLQNPMRFNGENIEELPNFFELYYASCAQVNETNSDVPHFQVRQNEEVVQRLIEFYTKIRDEKNLDENNSLTTYSLQVLELCRLLWGPVAQPANVQLINQAYFEEQRRRQMLSHWLDQCILSQPQPQQWVMQNCEFLSRGLFNECVKFAHDEGDLRLAALVHAASGSNHVRDILRHCAHEDIVDVYTKDFQRTIAILSGEFIVKGENLVDQNRTISWQMAFALHLWFANSTSDSISTIVRDFESAFQEHFWLEPTAHYGKTRALDLRWKLLKLYTDDTYPMDHVFDVQSYSQNAFDFRLSWILYVTLQSLGGHPLSIENDTAVHVHYAQQLENLGFWHLAIFVLLHINQATNRKKLVDQCLDRHVSSAVDLTEAEQSLIEKYHLALNRILLAKAQRAEYEKQWTNAVRLWINAKQWRRAHETYCADVFHETLLKGNYDFAKEVLDALDHQRANIAHWNRRGGFARQYIEFLILADKIQHGQTSLSDRQHTSLLLQVHRLCDQLSDVITEKYFKKISLVDISRRLLAILNYNTICSNLVHLNVDSEENLARKSNLFHQSILSSVPCSLPLDLLLQQIQVQSRAHRH